MARESSSPSPASPHPRPTWPPQSRVGHPRKFQAGPWSQNAQRNRAVLANLRSVTPPAPTSVTPERLTSQDIEALDTALAAFVGRLTAHWGALGPYVRVVASPVAASPAHCTPDQVYVPLLLWVSHRPITVAREARLREYLVRTWSHLDRWHQAMRQAGDYRMAQNPARLSPEEPLIEQWRRPNGVWPNIVKHSVIRLLWATWTPEHGWALVPFMLHGQRVTHPTRRDVQELARIMLEVDPPAASSVPMPVNRTFPLTLVWSVPIGATIVLLWLLQSYGGWAWLALLPTVLAIAFFRVLPPVTYRRTYRAWQRWCDRHWLLHS